MLGFKPKKSLGQNFLKSKKALEQIRNASDPNGDDVVLEIGPGKGVLTEVLLDFAGKVIAIEKDVRAIEFLKEKFAEEIKKERLVLIEEDVLGFDTETLKKIPAQGRDDKSVQGDSTYKVIANIPYYITGEILRKFLSAKYQPQSMTLLVQKEVAERIVARDGKESLLSISIKVFGEPKYVATVKKESFSPKPKVDSAILHIENISKNKLGNISEEKFFSVIKTGFSHKRKQLGSNLKNILDPRLHGDDSSDPFKKCSVEKTQRAEELSVNDWLCLLSLI